MKKCTACPICGDRADIMTQKEAYGAQWTIRKCFKCGHGFVENRPTQEFLVGIYMNHNLHHPIQDIQIAQSRFIKEYYYYPMVSRICRLTCERGFSLDIGSGSAALSLKLQEKGFRPVMIDVDPRAQEGAARVPGGLFVPCRFESFVFDGQFSVILMNHVLEHSVDPVEWLNHARKMLSQRGVLGVALPNFMGVYRILGSRDPFLCPPIHLNFFSPESLRIAFRKAGLKPVGFETRSRVVTRHPTRKFSWVRRFMGYTWNTVSRPLDLTLHGIVLHGYATSA